MFCHINVSSFTGIGASRHIAKRMHDVRQRAYQMDAEDVLP